MWIPISIPFSSSSSHFVTALHRHVYSSSIVEETLNPIISWDTRNAMTNTRSRPLCPLTGILETTILFVVESYLYKKCARKADTVYFKNSMEVMHKQKTKVSPRVCVCVCTCACICLCVLCVCMCVCVCVRARANRNSVQPAVTVDFI